MLLLALLFQLVIPYFRIFWPWLIIDRISHLYEETKIQMHWGKKP